MIHDMLLNSFPRPQVTDRDLSNVLNIDWSEAVDDRSWEISATIDELYELRAYVDAILPAVEVLEEALLGNIQHAIGVKGRALIWEVMDYLTDTDLDFDYNMVNDAAIFDVTEEAKMLLLLRFDGLTVIK